MKTFPAALVLSIATAVAVPPFAAAADASLGCPYLNQPVSAAKDKLAVYSPTGKFLRDAERKEIAADARVLACNEDLGLVKITLGGEEVWVDRLAVSIRPAGGAACVSKTISRAPDRTEPVSSGIGESCK